MGLDVCLKMPHRHFRCFAGNVIATLSTRASSLNRDVALCNSRHFVIKYCAWLSSLFVPGALRTSPPTRRKQARLLSAPTAIFQSRCLRSPPTSRHRLCRHLRQARPIRPLLVWTPPSQNHHSRQHRHRAMERQGLKATRNPSGKCSAHYRSI